MNKKTFALRVYDARRPPPLDLGAVVRLVTEEFMENVPPNLLSVIFDEMGRHAWLRGTPHQFQVWDCHEVRDANGLS